MLKGTIPFTAASNDATGDFSAGVTCYGTHPMTPVDQPHLNPYNDMQGGMIQPFHKTSIASQSLGDFRTPDGLYNKEKAEKLKQSMLVDSQQILHEYGNLIRKVYTILSSRNVDYEEVKMVTLFMKQLSSSLDMPEVEQSRSLISLMTSFHRYTSWFNYELIKIIAQDFGGEDGKAAIDNYEDLLKQFMSKNIFEFPQFMGNQTLPSSFHEFTLKIEEKYEHATLQDLALIKAKAVQLIDIEPHRLLLKSVERGCILTTWWIPSQYITRVTHRLTTQNLSALKVISFSIAGKMFDVERSQEDSYHYSIVPRFSTDHLCIMPPTEDIFDIRRGSADSSYTPSTLTSYSSSQTLSDHRLRSSGSRGRSSCSSASLPAVDTAIYTEELQANCTKKLKKTKTRSALGRFKDFFFRRGRKHASNIYRNEMNPNNSLGSSSRTSSESSATDQMQQTSKEDNKKKCDAPDDYCDSTLQHSLPFDELSTLPNADTENDPTLSNNVDEVICTPLSNNDDLVKGPRNRKRSNSLLASEELQERRKSMRNMIKNKPQRDSMFEGCEAEHVKVRLDSCGSLQSKRSSEYQSFLTNTSGYSSSDTLTSRFSVDNM